MLTLFQEIINIPSSYIIILFITLFYILEQTLATPFKFDKRSDHLFNNFLFQICIIGITFLFAMIQVFSIEWFSRNQFGLLNLIQAPYIIEVVIGIASLDFISYWAHRWSHKLPLLWKLHRVHHSDTTMDASTFFRNHPLEVLVSGLSGILTAAIFGIDIFILTLFLFISIPFMIMQHSNIIFPSWLDKVVGKVFITPNMHKVHHSQDQYYTDSNFANIFVFWDKLFGTYKYVTVDQITYGLKEFSEIEKQTFWYLLKSPFIKIEKAAENREADKKSCQLPNLTTNIKDEHSSNM